MHTVDVSPHWDTSQILINRDHQSMAGKALCIAMTADGTRLYLGGHSGVWRSDDGGLTWWHPERPQPPRGSVAVSGALLVPFVYDLSISPSNRDVVLAATGRDGRRPARSGIYRSTDGARSWTLVHQFVRSGQVGTAGSFAVAPDNASLVFAGSQYAIGLSTDGGRNWQDIVPPGSGTQAFWYVAVAAASGGTRHVYAVGTRVWHSADGGTTWTQDGFNQSLGSPADGVGECSRSICLHPTNPEVLYLSRNAGELWRGDFSGAGASGNAAWTMLAPPSIEYKGTTASGTDYVLAHNAPGGRFHLVFSDRRTVHIADREPSTASQWTRIDPPPVHVDPHGIAVTPDFRWASAGGASGKIAVVNDGGANVSTNGATSWIFGKGLSTLGIVNIAVQPRKGQAPALTIQMGDNNGFFSRDDGASWRTQDYQGGDNDCSFADPRQPNRLIVFAPRHIFPASPTDIRRAIYLYTAAEGQIPNAARGTSQRRIIPGPPPTPGDDPRLSPWTAVSSFYHTGYRPLVLTLDGEAPLPDGDFITIILTGSDFQTGKLLRTTAISTITKYEDWITTATAPGPGVKVFQQGPDLPDWRIGSVQASGGHARPTFYAGDPQEDASQGLWKWTQGRATWQQIVPGPSGTLAPAIARRFFVDPYRPNLVYVLDRDRICRSEDGGATWQVDAALGRAVTEEGAFPFALTQEAGDRQVVLRDMIFDPSTPDYRYAVGPAGVFFTTDGGSTWDHLLRSSAAGFRPVNAAYDRVTHPCARMLYVATSNRGVLRLGPLPPDWGVLPGGVASTRGRVTLLRLHDVGTGFGPPDDRLEGEVVVQLDSEPGRSFGFKLRADSREPAAAGMLTLLRDAFNTGRPVQVEFTRTGCSVGEIIRVFSP